MSYDNNNIFAKILRGEIPCEKIYEDKYVLSFHDINPQKIHALVIPKGKYVDMDDFCKNANNEEILGFFKGISKVAGIIGISLKEGNGYRTLSVKYRKAWWQEVLVICTSIYLVVKKLVKWLIND